tara:strand:+ start:1927 stop:2112 length:186 start_codon:yes stop_codon:yes gene_type:complete
MAFSIIKTMTNNETGKSVFVLLTNGLSEIWETNNEEEATKLADMLTENSDSGWEYTVRETK